MTQAQTLRSEATPPLDLLRAFPAAVFLKSSATNALPFSSILFPIYIFPEMFGKAAASPFITWTQIMELSTNGDVGGIKHVENS